MHPFESTVPTELRFVVNLCLISNIMFETHTAFTLCQLILSPTWTSDFGSNWLLRSELPQRRENFTSLYFRNLNRLILKQARQFIP